MPPVQALLRLQAGEHPDQEVDELMREIANLKGQNRMLHVTKKQQQQQHEKQNTESQQMQALRQWGGGGGDVWWGLTIRCVWAADARPC